MIVAQWVDPRRLSMGSARLVGRCTSRWDPAAIVTGVRHRRGQQKVEYGALESLVFFDNAVRRMGAAQLNSTLTFPQVDAIVAYLRTLTGTYRGRTVGVSP